MRILALDSSGLVASVAIVEEHQVIGEYTINYKQTHSQTLLPMLDSLVKQLNLDLATFDAIAVSGGPGSFTGLRIGAATAKGLGLALDIPIIHIPTAETMAYQLWGCRGYICPIMDARRAQVYTGIYTFDSTIEDGNSRNTSISSTATDLTSAVTSTLGFRIIEEQMALPMIELIEKLNQAGHPVTFLGDGVPVHQELIQAELKVPYAFAPPFASRQRAAAVGIRGFHYVATGKMDHARDHQPDYLRASQAERERLEKEASANNISDTHTPD